MFCSYVCLHVCSFVIYFSEQPSFVENVPSVSCLGASQFGLNYLCVPRVTASMSVRELPLLTAVE